MFRFSRKSFFDCYRKEFGKLAQLQVDGLETLLGFVEADPKWNSLQQLAYFFASIKHETGIVRNKVEQTFQPIKELRGRPGTKIRRIQDRYWGSDYYGRGYIQITWEANYKKFGLADEPEKALEPKTAYYVASEGMRRGLFTGKKLSDFINDQEVNYYDARTIVNGHDKASKIAEEAQKFYRILSAAESAVAEVEKKAPEPSVTSPVTDKPEVEEPLPAQTPTQTPVPTPQPEGITVQKVVQSLGSKLMAGGTVAMGALTAVGGALMGVLKNPYAFAIVILGCAALGVYAWNKSKERQLKLQLDLNAKAADRDSHTVKVAGPPPPNQ